MVPLQGAIVVCYGWAEGDDQFWWRGRGAMVGGQRVTTNFGGVVVVPLQGAIVVWYGWGAVGDDQFWWSGRGAIAAPLQLGRGRRPSLGAAMASMQTDLIFL